MCVYSHVYKMVMRKNLWEFNIFVYREEVQQLIECDKNCLTLNTRKTKEVVMDFRKPHQHQNNHTASLTTSCHLQHRDVQYIVDACAKQSYHVALSVLLCVFLFMLSFVFIM